MHPFARVAVCAVLLLVRCAPARVDFGGGDQAPDAITLRVLAIRATQDGVDIDLELRNDSTTTFLYTGYSTSQPLFEVRYLTERAWIEPLRAVCGTGLTTVGLAPGEHVALTARTFAQNRLQRLQVGIGEAYGESAVWSPIIDPATLSAGPAR